VGDGEWSAVQCSAASVDVRGSIFIITLLVHKG